MAVEKGWGNHKTEMAVGTGRNGWMGTLGHTVCLMGLIVYFLALSLQSLGNAHPTPHIKDFAGVRICVYFGKN